MGVGGNDSWSEVAAPLGQYQIRPGNYSYSFYISPRDILLRRKVGETKTVIMRTIKYLILFVAFISIFSNGFTQHKNPVETAFYNPPAEAKPMGIVVLDALRRFQRRDYR